MRNEQARQHIRAAAVEPGMGAAADTRHRAEGLFHRRVAPLLEQKQRQLDDTALAGEATRFEESIAYADGVSRWVEGVNVPHRDDDGRVLGYFALVQDVTERKRAAAEASEARQTLAEALQSTDHGIAMKLRC